MARNKKEYPVVSFGEFVDAELDKRGSSRRWLMAQLEMVHGIRLTDTKLSNRCKGHIPFEDDEKSAIENILTKFTNGAPRTKTRR